MSGNNARARRLGLLRRLRWLVVGVAFMLILAAIAVILGLWAVRRPLPQLSGTLQVSALAAPVEVLRDRLGVPALYGRSSTDLYRAQGFVHAQDRFWQMDVWRHVSAGRAAELLGRSYLPADRLIRTLGWEQLARDELALLRPESRDILVAYAEGVNAYLADRAVGELSVEHALSGLGADNGAPAAWEPVHSLAILRLVAWDANANLDRELEHLAGGSHGDVHPVYPEDGPLIVRPGDGGVPGQASPLTRSIRPSTRTSALDDFQQGVVAIRSLTGVSELGLGSNSWVLSGDLTASGAPILASDPHLGVQIPSVWYQMSLRCSIASPRCATQVTGFSLAGLPGIIAGHNGRVAWGFTNALVDVTDLQVELINPDNPDQYADGGGWIEMEVRNERLLASDGSEETMPVRHTRRGPVISDLDGDHGVEAVAGVDENEVVTLRWPGLEAQSAFDALPALNSARSGTEVRHAAALFTLASQNLLYADAAGTIGYQLTGRIPVRERGDGIGGAAWQGYIPFEQLPSVTNPQEGYIVTANNAIADESYPYLLGERFDMGYRAAQIQRLIEASSAPVTPQQMQGWQSDVTDGSASWLVPALAAVPAGDERVKIAQDALTAWSGQATADSAGAAVYSATWRHLLAAIFADLPVAPSGESRWFEVVRRMLREEQNPWWDDASTDTTEGRDEALATAMAAAVEELTERFGEDPRHWRWGAMHQLTFRHQTLGGIPLLRGYVNRGPFPVGGGMLTVHATAWHAAHGYEVVAIPSMRMIVDLGDLDASRALQATGQSGHVGHSDYASMIALWRDNALPPLRWTPSEVEAAILHRLRLEP